MHTQPRQPPFSFFIATLVMFWAISADGFIPAGPCAPYKPFVTNPTSTRTVADVPVRRSNMELNMFMGSDGGILGVGTPELFTILLVGYFVLGPSDLYKLTKEIGKFVQNIKSFSDEATSTLENTMESQLQLDEIRKAQAELNEAFNFRRSINVDSDTEAFEVNAKSPRPDPLAVEAPVAQESDGKPKKKIRRRRVKKKVVEEEPFSMGDVKGEVANNVPDLALDDDISESEKNMMDSLSRAKEELRKEQMEEEKAKLRKEREELMQGQSSGEKEQMEKEAAQLRKERMERLQGQSSGENLSAEQELASAEGYDMSVFSEEDAQSRFQQQLNGNWNDQILAKETELSPIADIMQRLAILEEEKNAADMRLQEEFRMREENEEKFYKEKRMLLEEAAAKVQAAAYATTGPAENVTNTTKS